MIGKGRAAPCSCRGFRSVCAIDWSKSALGLKPSLSGHHQLSARPGHNLAELVEECAIATNLATAGGKASLMDGRVSDAPRRSDRQKRGQRRSAS